MQIVNYFCARVLNSSDAAFSLAMKNNNYLAFAEKLISVKNTKVGCDLRNMPTSFSKEVFMKNKKHKYETLLKHIEETKSPSYVKYEILNYDPHIPRAKIIKQSESDHVYSIPFKNKKTENGVSPWEYEV